MVPGASSIWRLWQTHSAVPPGGGAASTADSAATDAARNAAGGPAVGIFGELSNAFGSARATFSALLELASLEAHRAGLTLMWMAICVGVAAFCLAAGWIGLLAALALLAVLAGVPLIAAVLAITILNFVAGALLIYACAGMTKDLLFPATRRQLAGNSPASKNP